ncbi:MAG TPA: TerD family protein [Acidobacteriota bacterium]|nr:TerD family protein [Acidobacteriota bacterium]
MQNFIRGQKARLSELVSGLSFEVVLQVGFSSQTPVDYCCFVVDASQRILDDRYLIYSRQMQSPCGSVRLLDGPGSPAARFLVNLASLPKQSQKLVFTATINGAPVMSQLAYGALQLIGSNGPAIQFPLSGADFSGEKSIIIGEVYFKDDWRIAAVGQGFSEGLNTLLRKFGGNQPGASPGAGPAQSPEIPTLVQPAPASRPPAAYQTMPITSARPDTSPNLPLQATTPFGPTNQPPGMPQPAAAPRAPQPPMPPTVAAPMAPPPYHPGVQTPAGSGIPTVAAGIPPASNTPYGNVPGAPPPQNQPWAASPNNPPPYTPPPPPTHAPRQPGSKLGKILAIGALLVVILFGGLIGIGFLVTKLKPKPTAEELARERQEKELKAFAKEVTTLSGLDSGSGRGYTTGKIYIVDKGLGIGDSLNYRVKPEWQAKSKDEIGTVVLVKKDSKVIGQYDLEGNGGKVDAKVYVWTVSVIDLKNKLITIEDELIGSDPPLSIKRKKGDRSPEFGGDPKLIEFIEKLDRKAVSGSDSSKSSGTDTEAPPKDPTGSPTAGEGWKQP